MTPADDLDTWIAESRAAQGLPERSTDPAVIDRLVALLLIPEDEPKRAAS